ncbi:outer membrane beta-barrel protein [Marinobacterium jannaschii]|uniref:outer membrane beta-barrel protein n=1 Tax=Marinobacterium jannaschii TaxID=64970 RepID=UPI0004849587|nr:outer membrane beta-barrel protein [Marinobacterium jannaschii]
MASKYPYLRLSVPPVIICLTLYASPTLAEDSVRGLYAGAGWLKASFKNNCAAVSELGFSGRCDDQDGSWKALLGGGLSEHWDWELGYYRGVESDLSGTINSNPVTGKTEVSSLASLSLLNRVSLGSEFSLFARIGGYYWDLDTHAQGSSTSVSLSDEGWDVLIGFGADLDLGKSAMIRFEWERFVAIGNDETTGEDDIDAWSASLIYKF